MNVNEEMLAGYADPDASYPDADPDATNLSTVYADADADLWIRIMSLCCRCGTLKNPYCSVAMRAEHRSKFLQSFTGNGDVPISVKNS